LLVSSNNPQSTEMGSPADPSVAATDSATIVVANIALHADCSGALFWPEEGALVVADLHLEKGSSFATRGVLLPPYDTATTLARLARVVADYAPRTVIALGDSFHDGDGPTRLSDRDRAALKAMQRTRDWIWIAGNHDPNPASGIGGTFMPTLTTGPLSFRHEPTTRGRTEWVLELGYDENLATRTSMSCIADTADGEISGHLHPTARVSQRGRSMTRRCFVTDGRRLIMPAFGAYTGGLNVRDRAFASVFRGLDFTVHLLGDRRLFALSAARCLAD
jgi:uncharacterized protein